MRIRTLGVVILVIALLFAPTFPLFSQNQEQAPTPEQTQTQEKTQEQKKTAGDPCKDKKSKENTECIGNRDVGKGLNTFSLEKEMALGKGIAQEVEKSAKLVDDPVVNEYVNRVGQNIVRNSDAKVPFTIKVIDSNAVNAFALPGGFFYVNSGLVLRADSEAELAGVMAHEIAHVAARHATKRATKGQLIQLATVPLIVLGPGGWAGYGIYQGLNTAIPLSMLKFSRNDEREADYLGLQYMDKVGYDPTAFVTFFEKIQAEEKRKPGTIPVVFNTHPPTADRIKKVQEEIATILPPRDQYIVTTSEFDAVKARLNRIENRNKLQETKPENDRPTLRTRTEKGQPSDTGSPQTPAPSQEPEDDRPKLERRPESQ